MIVDDAMVRLMRHDLICFVDGAKGISARHAHPSSLSDANGATLPFAEHANGTVTCASGAPNLATFDFHWYFLSGNYEFKSGSITLCSYFATTS
jgi:hypothetical protein